MKARSFKSSHKNDKLIKILGKIQKIWKLWNFNKIMSANISIHWMLMQRIRLKLNFYESSIMKMVSLFSVVWACTLIMIPILADHHPMSGSVSLRWYLLPLGNCTRIISIQSNSYDLTWRWNLNYNLVQLYTVVTAMYCTSWRIPKFCFHWLIYY